MESQGKNQPYHTLSNGQKMPLIGLGSYIVDSGDAFAKAILEGGYRHIDTASLYGNEEFVGDGVQKALATGKVKREEIFIVTKVWGEDYGNVEAALKLSLQKLKLDYVDLYLVHFPLAYRTVKEAEGDQPAVKERINIPIHKVWPQMEALHEKGLAKSIGISNFNVQLTWDLLSYCKVKPAVNQVEFHPFNTQEELLKFLIGNDIHPTAYSPLGQGGPNFPNIFETSVIKDLAQKYNRTPAQIALRWGLQRGCSVIPRSQSFDRQKENFDIYNFTLEEEEMAKITALNQNKRIIDLPMLFSNHSIFA